MLNLNLAPADLPLLQPQQISIDRDRLTFGVEIEFNLATLDEFDADDDPTPDDARAVLGISGSRIFHNHSHLERVELARKHIAKTLSDEGVPAEALDDTDPTWKPTDITAWIVKSDNIIKPPDGIFPYLFCPIEITTPVYYFSDAAVDMVKKVCEILSSTYRINVNNSCALHIHVGNGKKGLDLDTTRKLFTILYTFEPQIAQIHPSHRINNGFCQSLRAGSRLAKHLTDSGDAIARPGLQILRDAETMDDLKNYTTKADSSGGRLAYHMGNLLYDPTVHEYYPNKKTVEFRQHESTLDPERVANWARLCVGLVEFADTVDEDALHGFLERHIDHSPDEFATGQVLTALGMGHLAAYYVPRIEKME
jgi:hypothetical protein